MAAHPIPGRLYLTPTAVAGASGTLVTGIADDRIIFEDGVLVEHHGSGLEDDAWTTLRVPGEEPPALTIPVRDNAAETLKLLFAALSTGTALHSEGGQATPIGTSPPGVALIVRPRTPAAGSLYLYGPRWTIHRRNRGRIVWHRTEVSYEGSELVLMPRRSLDGSKRAFMWDTAANVAAYYGITP